MLNQKRTKQLLRTNWYYSVWIIYSFVLTFIMQWVQLGSLPNVLQFIHESTFYFVVNFGIVLASMSLVLLVKQKVFMFSLITSKRYCGSFPWNATDVFRRLSY